MNKKLFYTIAVFVILCVLWGLIEPNWRTLLYGGICKPENSKICLIKGINDNNFIVDVNIKFPNRGVVYTSKYRRYFLAIGVLNLDTKEYFSPTFLTTSNEESLKFRSGERFVISLKGTFKKNAEEKYLFHVDGSESVIIPAGKYKIWARLVFFNHPSLVNSEFTTYPDLEADNIIVELP